MNDRKTTSRARLLATDRSDVLINALLKISSLMGAPHQVDTILRRIVRITADLMQVPICSIYLIERDGVLRKRSNVGLKQELLAQSSFMPGEGIPGWVAQHGEMLALADVTKDPRYGSSPVALKEPHAYICAPLRIRNRVIGVLTARRMRVGRFTRNQCRVFETVAEIVATVIDKHRIRREKMEAQHLAAVATSLSEIAHYVKNIMFTTQVAEETVGKVIENEPSVARALTSWKQLKRSNQRIRKLVEDMLNYCRDRSSPHVETDIGGLVRGVVKDLEHHAEKHGVRIAAELDSSLGLVTVDQSAIYDVLLNLLTNAIDAIPADRPGWVIVRTRPASASDQYALEVEDNGIGISPEHRDRIFSLFFSTKGEGGTGIGLASSRKVIERHGGSITFKSEVGKGSRFIVTLPKVCVECSP